MMLRTLSLAGLLAVVAQAAPEPKIIVSQPRIVVGDILERSSLLVSGIDLGVAPPPGASRVLSRDEVERAIRQAGASPQGLAIPATIRVESAAIRTSTDDLATLLRPAITRQLTTGISLARLEPTGELLLPPRARLQGVTFSKPPRIRGNFRTVAVAEFGVEGAVVARATVPMTLDITDEAIRPDAPRGSRIAVIADVGAVQITTSALLTTDARIGDVATAQVASTGRIVRVRLTRSDRAIVVEGQ